MVEEAGNHKGENATSNPKSSVFDRFQPSTPQRCLSAFSRIGKDKTLKPYVF